MLQHSCTLSFVPLLRNTVDHVHCSLQSDQLHIKSGRTENLWERHIIGSNGTEYRTVWNRRYGTKKHLGEMGTEPNEHLDEIGAGAN